MPQLRAALDRLGRADLLIVVGGVIPPGDYDALHAAGASEIFGPGTVLSEAGARVVQRLSGGGTAS